MARTMQSDAPRMARLRNVLTLALAASTALPACMVDDYAATSAPTIDEATLADTLATGDYRGAGFVQMNATPFLSGLDPTARVTMFVSNAAAAAYEAVSPDSPASAGPEFPVGGVIVREAKDASGNVTLLTAMVKREAGYFPEVGDFFFGVADPAGVPMASAWGKDSDCATCHETRAAAGYLFGVAVAARGTSASGVHGDGGVRNSN
jgi:hypothetical protein